MSYSVEVGLPIDVTPSFLKFKGITVMPKVGGGFLKLDFGEGYQRWFPIGRIGPDGVTINVEENDV